MKKVDKKVLILSYTKLAAENGKHREQLQKIKEQLSMSHEEILNEAKRMIVR